jgi:TatD DNase family protein
VGVHPDNEGVHEPTVDDLLDARRRPRVVGIGETGLDYYRLNGRSVAEMAWQRERFAVHIRAARATGLPWWCTRAAPVADTLARAARRRAGRGARRLPLLHRDAGGGRSGAGPGLLHLVFGHPDLPQRRGTARVARMVPLDAA